MSFAKFLGRFIPRPPLLPEKPLIVSVSSEVLVLQTTTRNVLCHLIFVLLSHSAMLHPAIIAISTSSSIQPAVIPHRCNRVCSVYTTVLSPPPLQCRPSPSSLSYHLLSSLITTTILWFQSMSSQTFGHCKPYSTITARLTLSASVRLVLSSSVHLLLSSSVHLVPSSSVHLILSSSVRLVLPSSVRLALSTSVPYTFTLLHLNCFRHSSILSITIRANFPSSQTH